jgi:hypothetical protein
VIRIRITQTDVCDALGVCDSPGACDSYCYIRTADNHIDIPYPISISHIDLPYRSPISISDHILSLCRLPLTHHTSAGAAPPASATVLSAATNASCRVLCTECEAPRNTVSCTQHPPPSPPPPVPPPSPPPPLSAAAAPAPAPAPSPSALIQGLTLVHSSAQPKPCLTRNAP